MIRVASVMPFCPPYKQPLFRDLTQRMDLTMVFTSRGTEWYELGDRPTEIDGLKTCRITSPTRLYRELTSGDHDAIITTLTGRATLLATFGASKTQHLPLVLSITMWEHPQTLPHRISRPLVCTSYRSADAIVAFGPHVADFVYRESERKRDVFLARQAADNERFSVPVAAGAGQWPHYAASSISETTPMVTFVGRLEEDKGVAFLLDASAAVEIPHRLVIAGRGPSFEALQQQARRSTSKIECGSSVRY